MVELTIIYAFGRTNFRRNGANLKESICFLGRNCFLLSVLKDFFFQGNNREVKTLLQKNPKRQLYLGHLNNDERHDFALSQNKLSKATKGKLYGVWIYLQSSSDPDKKE